MQLKLNTMMKNIIRITLTVLVFLSNTLLTAQAPPPPGGGGGGTTPESAAAPIDMYVYFFAVIAMAFIVYFAKKYHKKLV